MKDTFHMGYNLGQAGFDFVAQEKKNNYNIEVLNGIAEDFVNASKKKAGVSCDKEEILNRFYEAAPVLTTAVPILVIYINSSYKIMLKFINRSNPLFSNLFIEEM
jgi:hypothetical protein